MLDMKDSASNVVWALVMSNLNTGTVPEKAGPSWLGDRWRYRWIGRFQCHHQKVRLGDAAANNAR